MLCYSIQGLVDIETDLSIQQLPEFFKVEGTLNSPDLRIIEADLNYEKPKDNEIMRGGYSYWREGKRLLLDYGYGAKLSIEGLEGETEVKYSNVLKKMSSEGRWNKILNTVLSIKLIQRGHALVHSGGLEIADKKKGILISGLQASGKTSTTLTLLEEDEMRFLADDLIILGEDGSVHPYPRMLRVSPHTLTGPISYKMDFREKILKSKLLGTLARRFGIVKSFKKLQKVPTHLVGDKCKVDKVFLLCGYGEKGTKKVNSGRAARAISAASVPPLDLFEGYLEVYYHLFDFDILNVLESRRRITEKALENTPSYEVTAKTLSGYSEAIKERIEIEC